MEFVYVLQCTASKGSGVTPGQDVYYVGYTKDLPARIYAHFCAGRGSRWTIMNPPNKIVCVQAGDKNMETALFAQYCAIYGHARVRGAAWCSVDGAPPSFIDRVEKYPLPCQEDSVTACSSRKCHTAVPSGGVSRFKLGQDYAPLESRSLAGSEDSCVAQSEEFGERIEPNFRPTASQSVLEDHGLIVHGYA